VDTRGTPRRCQQGAVVVAVAHDEVAVRGVAAHTGLATAAHVRAGEVDLTASRTVVDVDHAPLVAVVVGDLAPVLELVPVAEGDGAFAQVEIHDASCSCGEDVLVTTSRVRSREKYIQND